LRNPERFVVPSSTSVNTLSLAWDLESTPGRSKAVDLLSPPRGLVSSIRFSGIRFSGSTDPQDLGCNHDADTSIRGCNQLGDRAVRARRLC
jgi:hypothetical protein